jgi:hypothetical protein
VKIYRMFGLGAENGRGSGRAAAPFLCFVKKA